MQYTVEFSERYKDKQCFRLAYNRTVNTIRIEREKKNPDFNCGCFFDPLGLIHAEGCHVYPVVRNLLDSTYKRICEYKDTHNMDDFDNYNP